MGHKSVNYNEPVAVRDGLIAQFPDFTLTYDGEGREPLPESFVRSHPGGMTSFGYLYFTVSTPTEKKELKYSGGFGLYGRLKFFINDREFVLEAVPAHDFSIIIHPSS